jgi:hypothetical protein
MRHGNSSQFRGINALQVDASWMFQCRVRSNCGCVRGESMLFGQSHISPPLIRCKMLDIHSSADSSIVGYKQLYTWRRPSTGMWRRVVLARTDVSEERSSSIIWVKRTSEIGRTLTVASNWNTLRRSNQVPTSLVPSILMMEVIRSSETSVLKRATRCGIS